MGSKKKYDIRDKRDSFKELIKDRKDLNDIVEGFDLVYELRKKILTLRLDEDLSQEELVNKAYVLTYTYGRI